VIHRFAFRRLTRSEFSTKLQAAGGNATAYAAKLPGGQISVMRVQYFGFDRAADAATEIEFRLKVRLRVLVQN
jgi:hypothetical protein